ncbi:MAG: RecX family transcriptional regulator [Crocinitomicaceae bacterium]|nr:RecX family transcriptional regulator [Crocinitomicaceae bacterium]
MENAKAKYSLLEAKMKIEAYCAYQERCDQEVRKKLHSWNMDSEHVDILISDLITNRFLNEERFASAYTSGKVNIKRWGRKKIKLNLKFKQISDYSINKALKEIDQEVYWNNLMHLANKKWAALKEPNHYKKKAKLLTFLNTKGYEMDLMNEAVKEILNQD